MTRSAHQAAVEASARVSIKVCDESVLIHSQANIEKITALDILS
jgi:hypothetical protein